jgi:hypothetical protein
MAITKYRFVIVLAFQPATSRMASLFSETILCDFSPTTDLSRHATILELTSLMTTRALTVTGTKAEKTRLIRGRYGPALSTEHSRSPRAE